MASLNEKKKFTNADRFEFLSPQGSIEDIKSVCTVTKTMKY